MDNEKIEEVISPIDYATLTKELLISIKEGLEALKLLVGELSELEIEVAKLETALDYMFYLEDNRRVIV